MDAFADWIVEDKDPEGILEARDERWDFVGDLGVPVPKGKWYRCPVCASPDAHWSSMHLAQRPGSVVPHRAEVYFHCKSCHLLVGYFSVPLTTEHWHALASHRAAWRWRDVLRVLKGEGD